MKIMSLLPLEKNHVLQTKKKMMMMKLHLSCSEKLPNVAIFLEI